MRRTKPEKRKVEPDVRYNSTMISGFVNRLMQRGKKSTALGIVYDAFDLIAERTGQEGLEVFEQAIRNASPILEVKPRRVGGATYQVPVEVAPERRTSLAMRWLIAGAEGRYGKSMAVKLADELLDAQSNAGSAVRKKEEAHRMAEANRAFAHYRW